MGLVLAFNRRNAQPKFNTPASISGTVREGQTLSVTWEVIRARRVAVEWTSYTDAAATQNPRLVGQSTDLLVPSSDVGRYLVCRVYASNAAGSVVSVAGPTIAVESANAPDPYFSVLPSLSGDAVVGETMTLSYTPVNAITEQRQWYAYTNPGGDETGRLTLGTGLTQSIPAGADGYYIGALVRLFDADGDVAEDHTDLVGPVTPGAEDPGAPELPRVTPSHLPPTGWDGTADVTLTDATSLQTWLNANAPIDTSGGNYIVELTAGDVWTGNISVPANLNTGENWVIFRTSGYANLPAAGNRLQPSPANDADLAVIQGAAAYGVKTVTSISRVDKTATVTFSAPHGYTTSNYINIWGTDSGGTNVFDGAEYKVNSVPTPETVTISLKGSQSPPLTSATGGYACRQDFAKSYAFHSPNGGQKKVAFIGIEFRPGENVFAYQNVWWQGGSNDGLCFYQCRFTTLTDRRIRDTMLRPEGSNVTVSCCDFFVRRRDYAAANVANGYMVGPNDGAFAVRLMVGTGIRLYNNRLQSGGPSVFISDSYATYVPRDITMDKNYLYRPRAWEDLEAHKNAFEYKGVERLLMEGNIFEWTWDGLQPPAHLMVLKNASSWANDITIRNNILRSGVACVAMEGSTGPNIVEPHSRCTIENNLFYDINRTYGNNNSTWDAELLYWSGGVRHLRFVKNTVVASEGRLLVRSAWGSPNTIGFRFVDNVIVPTLQPPYSMVWAWNKSSPTPTTQGLIALNGEVPDYVITNNVWTKRTSQMLEGDTRTTVKDGSTCQNNYYYIGNHLQVGPSASEALFVDYDNENYRINPAGSLATVASDGGPPGADIDVVNAATANVETGTLS